MAVDLPRLRQFIADNAGVKTVAVSMTNLEAFEREITELRAAEAMRGANVAMLTVLDTLQIGATA